MFFHQVKKDENESNFEFVTIETPVYPKKWSKFLKNDLTFVWKRTNFIAIFKRTLWPTISVGFSHFDKPLNTYLVQTYAIKTPVKSICWTMTFWRSRIPTTLYEFSNSKHCIPDSVICIYWLLISMLYSYFSFTSLKDPFFKYRNGT